MPINQLVVRTADETKKDKSENSILVQLQLLLCAMPHSLTLLQQT